LLRNNPKSININKTIAFSASISADSSNHQLVEFTANLFENVEIEFIWLADFMAPHFSKELNIEYAVPNSILELR
jgi:NAD(P)H-dependent FMN reductase